MTIFFTFVYGITFVFSLLCLWIISNQKPNEFRKPIIKIVITTCIFMTGYWFRITAKLPGEVIIAEKLILLAGAFCYYFIFSFLLQFLNVKMNSVVQWILRILSVAIATAGFTFDMHSLVFTEYTLEENIEGLISLNAKSGFVLYLYAISTVGYLVAMIVMAVVNLKKNSKRRISQSVFIVLLELMLGVTTLIDIIEGTQYNVAPVGIAFALALLMICVYVIGLYDVTDSTRTEAMKHIDSAVLVVDSRGHFLNCNPLMMEIFPVLKRIGVGENMERDEFSDVRKLLDGEVHEWEHKDRIYEAGAFPLKNREKVIGQMLWLSDVTEHVKYKQLSEATRAELEKTVDEKIKYIIKIQGRIMMSMAEIIENRDDNTGGHVKRTRYIVSMIAKEMQEDGFPGVDKRFVECVGNTAPLHDIGKICIDDAILRKPGKLDDNEYEIMKTHSARGAQMIEVILADVEEEDVRNFTGNIVRFHHERWDGKGYPDRLSGDDIPLEARVMAIADVYDALVSKRCYKASMPFEQANQIMEESFGTSFDPKLRKYYEICRERMEAFYAKERENESSAG